MNEILLPPPARIVVPEEGAAILERLAWEARRTRGRQEVRRARAAALDDLGLRFAEIFPDEGLSYLLDVVPRAASAAPSTLYMGLFSSQTPTTVPARDAVLSTQTGVAELTSSGGYARSAIAAASWPAAAQVAGGMRTTIASPGTSFPTTTGAYSAAINGYFLATTSGIGTGIAVCYSNFADGVAITVNASGFTVRVQPYLELDS